MYKRIIKVSGDTDRLMQSLRVSGLGSVCGTGLLLFFSFFLFLFPSCRP